MSGQTPRRSRIAHFKAPFIVSVAAPAAIGLACGGKAEVERLDPTWNPPQIGGSSGTYDPLANVSPTSGGSGGMPSTQPCSGKPPVRDDSYCGGYQCVNGEWQPVPSACNPPPLLAPTCPATEPQLGTPCAQFGGGMVCEYEYCYGPAPTRRCSYATGLWEALPLPSCNPPECPTSMPVAGSDCGAEGQECLYPVCEPNLSSATCHFGQWAVVYSPGAACNPPAVVDPVCPQRAIVAGANCWFEEQLCGNGAPCVAGRRYGLQCVGGHWQGEALNCSGEPDGGI